MDERTDERTDEQKSPCVLQDFVPFGATALLLLIPIYNHAKQGNGYRWPHIALGRPVENGFLSFSLPMQFLSVWWEWISRPWIVSLSNLVVSAIVWHFFCLLVLCPFSLLRSSFSRFSRWSQSNYLFGRRSCLKWLTKIAFSAVGRLIGWLVGRYIMNSFDNPHGARIGLLGFFFLLLSTVR